ncbi:MAG TPA: hypothetical protein VKU89_03110 [Solirubrobacteraceae bacterium]|nr:hypothetical protein [Solirubrobacteraceae bacterium]
MQQETAEESSGIGQAATAQLAPTTRIDRILALVPRALSSHLHIIFLAGLGVFLVLLPLVGVGVSAKAELIGGNYTNVTSDLGACIAAGLTVHLVRREHRRSEELHRMLERMHAHHQEVARSLAATQALLERAERAVRKDA